MRERKSERRVHLFWGGVDRIFSGRESCYRGRKAVTEKGISSFWVRVRTGEKVIFSGHFERDIFFLGEFLA